MRMRWLDSFTDSTDMNLSKFWEIVEDRAACCLGACSRKELDMTQRLNNNKRTLLTYGGSIHIHTNIGREDEEMVKVAMNAM